MNEDRDFQNLSRKLDSLTSEVRICRWLLAFVLLILAVILFFPRLAEGLGAFGQAVLSCIVPFGGGIIVGGVALVLAFLAGACIVARLHPKPPSVALHERRGDA